MRALRFTNVNHLPKPLYTPPILQKYNHIKESIARQNPITRLFIKIILIFCRFHHNFNEFVLSYLSYRPDLSRVEKIQQELSTKTLKGGFTNAGNTCFIAAPLHCLNTMKELLPKHVDLMKNLKMKHTRNLPNVNLRLKRS
ncbi:MAG: hypothetical protein HWD61_02270 [Parachlamydiaceae bacterium]|nr:MAG: hypothetical protein HWD61_02270 [Parachlamydiaceae bacterium]